MESSQRDWERLNELSQLFILWSQELPEDLEFVLKTIEEVRSLSESLVGPDAAQSIKHQQFRKWLSRAARALENALRAQKEVLAHQLGQLSRSAPLLRGYRIPEPKRDGTFDSNS